jgi:hypothetical protein
MANHSVDYLRRLRDAVDDFTTAFEDWMKTQVESDHLFVARAVPLRVSEHE